MKKILTMLACFALVLVGGISLCACNSETTMAEADFTKQIEEVQPEGEVKLTGNVTLSKTVEINKQVKINLNGFKIKENMTYSSSQENKVLTMFQIVDGGQLTIAGEGSVVSDDLYIFNVQGSAETHSAKLVIENGKFQTDCSVVQVVYGTAQIKGGHFQITKPEYVERQYLLNRMEINNGVGQEASIEVSGGTFVEFDPSDAKNDAKVAQGFEVKHEEGSKIYTVVAQEAV